MKRGKPRNERAKSTNRESTNKATQTINIDTVVEIARLQEQLRLLQLENDVLRQHMSNKRDHASIYMPLSVETQEIPQANAKAVTCGCKGNCSTKRCGCVKENNKCTASCKCSAATCQNQELKDQNEELDQENKENITTNGMETPKKREKVIQSEVVVKMKTKGKDLASDKITNDVNEQFDPMKPKHQLSRTPPTKNRTFVSEVSYSDDKLKSESPESSQILVSSFNVKANTSDIEAEVDWEQHRAQLVPCKKCKRTFMPHRIQKHEACCKKI